MVSLVEPRTSNGLDSIIEYLTLDANKLVTVVTRLSDPQPGFRIKQESGPSDEPRLTQGPNKMAGVGKPVYSDGFALKFRKEIPYRRSSTSTFPEDSSYVSPTSIESRWLTNSNTVQDQTNFIRISLWKDHHVSVYKIPREPAHGHSIRNFEISRLVFGPLLFNPCVPCAQ